MRVGELVAMDGSDVSVAGAWCCRSLLGGMVVELRSVSSRGRFLLISMIECNCALIEGLLKLNRGC